MLNGEDSVDTAKFDCSANKVDALRDVTYVMLTASIP